MYSSLSSRKRVSVPVSLLAGLLVGAVWGLFNGVLITKFKLESFILTMGTSYLIRGLILFFTNGIYIKVFRIGSIIFLTQKLEYQ